MTILKQLVSRPMSLTGILLLFFFIVVAVAAPWLAPPPRPHEPYRIPRDGFWAEPRPPSEDHPFGTSEGQYDIYYGIIWGTRTAFRVGLIVTGVACAIGMVIGSIGGFYGGIFDEILMRIADIFYTLPFLVAAMVVTVVLGRGINKVIIAMIMFSWMGYARLIRSEVLTVKQTDYAQAAKAIGAGDTRILFRHIIPNSIYPMFVLVSMNIGSMVLWASALSFLGLGSGVGYADWGQMISFSRNWLLGTRGNPLAFWYTVVYPGAAIVFFVLAWNLVGDTLRDILDPRLRGVR